MNRAMLRKVLMVGAGGDGHVVPDDHGQRRLASLGWLLWLRRRARPGMDGVQLRLLRQRLGWLGGAGLLRLWILSAGLRARVHVVLHALLL